MTRDTGFPPAVKTRVWERAKGRCEVCGEATSDLQYHHRRPRQMGSTKRPDTNTAANCLLLCMMDHHRVESHRAQAYDNGHLLRSTQSPEAEPVLRLGVWVLLTVDGRIEAAA